MADTQFDEARARSWITEVQGELDDVNKLLQEVAIECETQPYEDDTIMNTLVSTGRSLGEAWGGVVSTFQEAVNGCLSILQSIVSGVGKTLEVIGSFMQGKSY